MKESLPTRLLYNFLDWTTRKDPIPSYVSHNYMKTIIGDPGHGMSNREHLKYDPGVCFAGFQEASIAMDWVNTFREVCQARGFKFIRTRVDSKDPAPVSRRDDIARAYQGDIMLSFHVNSTPGATGTEVIYRGPEDKPLAARLSAAVATTLGLKDRGAKDESASPHKRLAVMDFRDCWLIELGFIENADDRKKILDPVLRRKTCEKLCAIVEDHLHDN